MTKEEIDLRDEAATSLDRMQTFDADSLVREEDLGRALNFKDAVAPAERLIELYRRLSPAALEDFPTDKLTQIRNLANQDFNLLNQIITFSAEQSNPQNVRQSLIQQLSSAYPNTFNILHPLVAYSLHRSADFERLDRDARGTLQLVKDRAAELTDELQGKLDAATTIVEDVRKVAAETGVSQQATYFRDEAAEHNGEAEKWRTRTVNMAWLLGAYAFISLFIAKVPFLSPTNSYESIQLIVSKILIFAVISYMLYLSSRNFLSHKHNGIVNKHRQNALMTFKALVDAAVTPDNRDVVLTHASACIFAPQSTGYSEGGGVDAAKATSVIEILGKPITNG